MNALEAIELGRQTIIVFIKLSMPLLLVALVVGLIVSLFQALTQIQEMTLSFVPKLLFLFGAMILLMPFMLRTLEDFSSDLNNRIIAVGHSED